jgi:hypothetical protein
MGLHIENGVLDHFSLINQRSNCKIMLGKASTESHNLISCETQVQFLNLGNAPFINFYAFSFVKVLFENWEDLTECWQRNS